MSIPLYGAGFGIHRPCTKIGLHGLHPVHPSLEGGRTPIFRLTMQPSCVDSKGHLVENTRQSQRYPSGWLIHFWMCSPSEHDSMSLCIVRIDMYSEGSVVGYWAAILFTSPIPPLSGTCPQPGQSDAGICTWSCPKAVPRQYGMGGSSMQLGQDGGARMMFGTCLESQN